MDVNMNAARTQYDLNIKISDAEWEDLDTTLRYAAQACREKSSHNYAALLDNLRYAFDEAIGANHPYENNTKQKSSANTSWLTTETRKGL